MSTAAHHADAAGALDVSLLRTLRIGCIGSGGTGKSTFVRWVSDTHGIRRVDEGVREWLAAHGETGLATLDAAQVSRLSWDVLDHRDRETTQAPFIADRTAVDSICFAQSLGERLEDFEALRARAEGIARRVDVYVFFPFRSEYLAHAGIRKQSPIFQLSMSSALFRELGRLDLLERVHVFEHHRSVEWNLAAAVSVARHASIAANHTLGHFDPARAP
jgi:nicotinamide riboside kinase